MKLLRKKASPVCFFIMLLFLLESCTVYKSTPISLDQAVATKRRVKLITTDNQKLHFKQIEKTDSVYYGLKTINGEKVRIALNQNNIKAIKEPNKVTSTILTAGIITTAVAFFAVIIFGETFEFKTGAGPVGGF